MDDYYAIVGVRRSAPAATIDRAIREQLRRWQRRTASANLASRQQAEWRVQQLGEARAVLLDEQRRRQYDRELDASRSAPASDVPASDVPGREVVEYRLRPAHRSYSLVSGGVLLTLALVWGGIGVPALSVLSVIVALFFVAAYFARRDHGVVLSPEGLTVRAEVIKHYPWAQIRAIEAVETKDVLRVEIQTVDGVRLRAPAPRGSLPIDDRDFAEKLATLRRWHQHYTAPSST